MGHVLCSILRGVWIESSHRGPSAIEHQLPVAITCSLPYIPSLPFSLLHPSSNLSFLRSLPKLITYTWILISVFLRKPSLRERPTRVARRGQGPASELSQQRRHKAEEEREWDTYSSWHHIGHLDPAMPEGWITLRFALGQNMLVQDSTVFFVTLHISFQCFPACPQISIPAVLASAHVVQWQECIPRAAGACLIWEGVWATRVADSSNPSLHFQANNLLAASFSLLCSCLPANLRPGHPSGDVNSSPSSAWLTVTLTHHWTGDAALN